MGKLFRLVCVLLAPLIFVTGCDFGTFDDSDRIMTSDKAVTAEDLARVTSYLLKAIPYVREEKARLAEGGKKIKLTLNVLAAPEVDYPKDGPDYDQNANYYEVYVSYSDKDSLLKYDTYHVQKDLKDVYRYDSAKDEYVKITQ